MVRWFQQLDRILRGELARPDALHAGRFQFSIGGVSFVGIEMGWMLRPFIGSLGDKVEFFRREPLDNAYVIVGRMIWDAVR